MTQLWCTNPVCQVAEDNILYRGAKCCGVARVQIAAIQNSGAQHFEDP
jgi:hypothetical protein